MDGRERAHPNPAQLRFARIGEITIFATASKASHELRAFGYWSVAVRQPRQACSDSYKPVRILE
jgi:hypothetical protein